MFFAEILCSDHQVMEFCEKTSLYAVLNRKIGVPKWDNEELTIKRAVKWMSQSTAGIRDLHYSKPAIYHRDLKSMNLLIDQFDNCKICDFGTAREYSLANPQTFKAQRTTPLWCPPELFDSGPQKFYSPHSDMYSLGVIFWEIVNTLIQNKYVYTSS